MKRCTFSSNISSSVSPSITLSALLLAALLLAGCGQKGPLYMPDNDTQDSAAEQEG